MSNETARPDDPYLRYRRNLLDVQRVRELSQLRPARAIRDALACWICIVAAWVFVAYVPRWWSVLLAIPLIGTRFYALFIIGHDGLHRRLFPDAKRNDFWTDLLVFAPIGAIRRLNNRNHLSHHQHLSTEADPDRHKHGSFNKGSPLALIGYLTGVSSVLRSVANVFRPPAARTKEAKSAAARYTPRDLTLLLGWQVALIGGLSWGIGLWAWPVLWLFPVYVFAFLGDNARAFLEHAHPESDRAADRHRLITFTSHPLELMFFAPMHMNFHAAHHLWPSIPYYNLPIAERELRQLPAASDLEQRGSYLAFLWRYYRALPLASQQSDSEPTTA